MEQAKKKTIAERIKSIAAGKKVPCGVCHEALIPVHTKKGDIAGAKCPHGHESWPLVNGEYPREPDSIQKMIQSVEEGKKIPCCVCGEPLISVYSKYQTLAGAKCPHEHEAYCVVHGV